MGFSVSTPTTGVPEARASQRLWVNEGGLRSQGSASPLCYPSPVCSSSVACGREPPAEKVALFLSYCCPKKAFPGGSVVKNLPANAGDEGLIPGTGRGPGRRNDNHCGILTWKMFGGLPFMGSQRVGHA